MSASVYAPSVCSRASLFVSDAEDYLRTYKFIAVFENSNCKDYVTEKLWRAYKMGVVPGVRGLRLCCDHSVYQSLGAISFKWHLYAAGNPTLVLSPYWAVRTYKQAQRCAGKGLHP